MNEIAWALVILGCIAFAAGEVLLARAYFKTVATEMKTLRTTLEAARKGLEAVNDLISESTGVIGLHLNGDVAEWRDLQTGGRFEVWLQDFDSALVAVTPKCATCGAIFCAHLSALAAKDSAT